MKPIRYLGHILKLQNSGAHVMFRAYRKGSVVESSEYLTELKNKVRLRIGSQKPPAPSAGAV